MTIKVDKKGGLRPESCLLFVDSGHLTGIERPVYDVAISFELPSKPEASRNGKSRLRGLIMNVVWVISDTLRRDHIGCYGNKVIHTPSMDALAARSVRFDRHYIGSFPTMPTRADFFTGRWSGSFMNWGPLPGDQATVPEILNQNGFNTTAVVDTPFYLRNNMNYDRGFTAFYEIPGQSGSAGPDTLDVLPSWRVESDRFAPRTFTQAMEWLERHHKEDFFLLVDTWDPHEPWTPPAYYAELYWPEDGGEVVMPSREELFYGLRKTDNEFLRPTEENIRKGHAFYCGEVTMVDTWLGYFLRRLENMDLMKKTAIVFTSDHGTYHGEHGGRFSKTTRAYLPDGSVPRRGDHPPLFRHEWGYSPLYEEVAAAPLLIHVPSIPPGSYSGLTSAIDLGPTVLDILGQEIPSSMEGTVIIASHEGLLCGWPRVCAQWGPIHQ